MVEVASATANATVNGNFTKDATNGETAANFAATINGTDGFIFFGYVKGSVATPSFKDLKMGNLANNTKFEKFWFPFVKNGKSIKIPVTGLTAAT